VVVCRNKKPHLRFLRLIFLACFLAKRYVLQQKCLKGQIGTCLLGTRWYNRESHNAQRHRQTDKRDDSANSLITLDHTRLKAKVSEPAIGTRWYNF